MTTVELKYNSLTEKATITATKNGEVIECKEYPREEVDIAIVRFYALTIEKKEQKLEREKIEAFNSLENSVHIAGMDPKDIYKALDELTVAVQPNKE